MSIPAFFSKFNKQAKSLLKSDDFDLQRTYKYCTFSQSGVKFTATGELTSDASDATATFEAEYANNDYGKANLKFNTKDLVDAKYTTKELVDGVKVVVHTNADKVEDEDTKGKFNQVCNLSVEGQYTRENFAGTLMVDVVKPEDSKSEEFEISASASGGVDKIALGGSIKYAKDDLQDYDVGAQYNLDDAVAVLQTKKKFSKFVLSYHHKVNSAVSVAAQFDLGVKKNGNNYDLSKTANFGWNHSIDDFSSVKTLFTKKEGKNLTVSHLYTTDVNPSTRLSLSCQVDLQNLKKGNHQFGIQLENGEL